MIQVQALAMTPNIDVPRLADERYELPIGERMRAFGLGCVCSPAQGVPLGVWNAATSALCECANERRMDFVTVQSIRASVTREVPAWGMSLSEYDAWFTASEQAEHDADPAYRGGAFTYVEYDEDGNDIPASEEEAA